MDQRQFRNALGCFATGVAIASIQARDGRMIGVTVNSFTSVSLQPPLILFCLARDTGRIDDFKVATDFSISVLADHQEPISQHFATPGVAEWRGFDFHKGSNGVAIADHAIAAFECSMHEQYSGGDHVIIVGKVEKFYYNDETDPIIYYRGAYSRLLLE